MKKHLLYAALLGGLCSLGVTSCGDNEDVSREHVLTDAEIAEMARQDSIEEAQRNQINADLILEYTADITLSTVAYDGAQVTVETDKIAELFGISEEDLLAGIALESGAPEITGFAIEGSTHADNMTASNSNSTWGHWFDAKGDVVAWGTSAMVCCEFNTEDKFFNVMQYPGHLTDGQTVKVIEGLKYGEKRVAVVITVNAHGAAAITAPVVSTQKLSIDVNPASTYDLNNVEFNADQVKADLGISSMDDVEKFVAVKSDGSYAQESDAGTNGFWFDVDGYASGYSDNSRIYTSYGGDEWVENEIGIGQYPGKTAVGDSYTFNYGFLANNKIVMMEITVNVVAYNDPETAPEGTPEEKTIDVTLTKNYTTDYANVQYDIRDVLRQAFKMTTYQIHSARVSKELKIYCKEESSEDPEYTADVPGYWLGEDGSAVKFAEGIGWVSLGTSETELYLYGGNHPENVSPTAGATVKTTYIITCNGGKVTVNLTLQIDPQVEE
ncbi:DUF4859 domain-containing protein [Bacteroides mediterraneensis]|uniref:DUF4859 domain-containing protein n=1 Tax=Bacteroides mediterraneensis TaxID=1841856 RepID=UPI00195B6EEB|nr:DUF4859 domain-containing protein [Bacteroides mediterraneensis]MBM6781927.1 DUF4859 domain-containing protein [Bacteroides mediterraneensis]